MLINLDFAKMWQELPGRVQRSRKLKADAKAALIEFINEIQNAEIQDQVEKSSAPSDVAPSDVIEFPANNPFVHKPFRLEPWDIKQLPDNPQPPDEAA